MTLRALLEEVEVLGGAPDLEAEVGGIAYDSRRVRPGDLFFALAGQRHDGAGFVREALERGAAAAVVEAGTPPGDPRVLAVREPRRALALAARAFHGHPARALAVVGVTGTNGKTTSTYLLEAIFREAGRTPGVIGTTGVRIDRETRDSAFTTPEAPELQGLLAEMRARGVSAVAIEVSSHALVQRRSYGLECDVVAFTNLSHDHLDFHGTLEAYLDAKLMLFDGRNLPRRGKAATAVVNADDPHGARVAAAAAAGGLPVIRYGEQAGADVAIAGLSVEPRGLAFELRRGAETTPVRLPLLGRYNAWNAAGAFAAALALGIAPQAAARGLERAAAVPGRLERVDLGQPFDVVVDYAHTPDGLGAALRAAREHARGRVLLVFGCGGDRDRAKRPIMGRVASRLADRAWITSDNPRSEDPAAIAAEVAAGAERALETELDRRAAIERAIAAARPGDLVLVAGKGHETTQTLADRVVPFDDREVARALLRAAGGARG